MIISPLDFALTESRTIDVCHRRAAGFYFGNAGWAARHGGRRTAEPEAKKSGDRSPLMRAAAKVSDAAILDLTLTLDGVDVQLAAHGLAIANGRYLGGFPVVPDAILDDGLLDIAAVRAQGSMEMLSAAVSTLLDRQKSDEKIFNARARNVQVRSTTPLRLKFDGEPLESESFDLAVLPRAIHVVGGTEDACLGSVEAK
jgi:diacylglycerol kinase family enzyme